MAKKFSTPGVFVTELDISEVVAPAGTSTGVVVGAARKGMVNARTLLTTDKELIETFGIASPDWLTTTAASDAGIYAGVEFLQESNAMYFTRVTDGSETYANLVFGLTEVLTTSSIPASSTAQRIAAADSAFTKTEILDIDDFSTDTDQLVIAAIGPGKEGNLVGIRVTTSASFEGSSEATASGTSAYVAATSADFDWGYSYDAPDGDGTVATSAGGETWRKVFKIEVFTRASETATFPLIAAETFHGSVGDVLGPNGANLNIEKAVNGFSKLIYMETDQMTVGKVPFYTSGAGSDGTGSVALSNGSDSSTYGPDLTTTAPIVASAILNGWSYYSDKEKVQPNILIGSYYATAAITGGQAALKEPVSIAGNRKDCIATVQVGAPATTDKTTIINEGNTQSFSAPSYGAKYCGWSLVYDSFNDKDVFLPNSLYGAKLYARTDNVANTWNAPAGIKRGKLAVLGQNQKFNNTEIGLLYDANINAVKFINGEGNVIWGQRTAQKTVTALREIAVRRLMLFLEGTIEPFLLPFVFEQNTEAVRVRIASLIEGFLTTVQSGGGVQEFKVVVDDSNNSANDTDNGVLNIDIYIKPTRTIEFINVQFIITGSGVSLAELIV